MTLIIGKLFIHKFFYLVFYSEHMYIDLLPTELRKYKFRIDPSNKNKCINNKINLKLFFQFFIIYINKQIIINLSV